MTNPEYQSSFTVPYILQLTQLMHVPSSWQRREYDTVKTSFLTVTLFNIKAGFLNSRHLCYAIPFFVQVSSAIKGFFTKIGAERSGALFLL